MSNSLSYVLNRLKQSDAIRSVPDFVEIIGNIDRYGDHDTTKAYFLGYFFKHHLDSDNLSPLDKEFLITEIKQRNLSDYFYLKEKPDTSSSAFELYVFVSMGIAIAGIGIIQLTTGYFTFLTNVKYDTPVIREGGYYVMFGLILFIGGILSYRFERKRKQFIRSFLT